jgi:hypothetical protein
MRRTSSVICSFIFCITALVGCATPEPPRWTTYEEAVSSILISQDEQTLVVVTPNYHYILGASPGIVKTLKSSFKKYVSAYFSDFKVDLSGSIEGKVQLNVDGLAIVIDEGIDSEKKIDEAKSIGYQERYSQPFLVYDNDKPLKWMPGPLLVYKDIPLKGKRYKAESQLPKEIMLNKTYRILVTEERTQEAIEEERRKLQSPIRVAKDGLVTIASIPLFVIFGLGGTAACMAVRPDGQCY